MGKRLLLVPSCTQGRPGLPCSHQKIAHEIETCKEVLDEMVPDEPIYGYGGIDYSWAVLLDDKEVEELLQGYPDSLEDSGTWYISNGRSKMADEFVVPKGSRIVQVSENDHAVGFLQKRGPVAGRDFETMYEDWFDHYGKYGC